MTVYKNISLYKQCTSPLVSSFMYEFPLRLPNPDSPYMPDAYDQDRSSGTPLHGRIKTFPGLFQTKFGGDDGVHPIVGVSFLHMSDAFRLQALFAASQFLASRCRQNQVINIPGLCPIQRQPSSSLSLRYLYLEIEIFKQMLVQVMDQATRSHLSENATIAYRGFVEDMRVYASWLTVERRPVYYDEWMLEIDNALAKLCEVEDLVTDYRNARVRFEEGKTSMLGKRKRVSTTSGRVLFVRVKGWCSLFPK